MIMVREKLVAAKHVSLCQKTKGMNMRLFFMY
jgi:hypothetical protein